MKTVQLAPFVRFYYPHRAQVAYEYDLSHDAYLYALTVEVMSCSDGSRSTWQSVIRHATPRPATSREMNRLFSQLYEAIERQVRLKYRLAPIQVNNHGRKW